MEIKKDEIQNVKGTTFLIPVEVLPKATGLFRLGAYVRFSVAGPLVEVEGQKFLQVDIWKLR